MAEKLFNRKDKDILMRLFVMIILTVTNATKAKEHGMFYQCDICYKELEAKEAIGIGYICCVCDTEFEIATELEDQMSMDDNVLPH